ncbi:MAG: DUF2764 family protein [Rikenellaceae bacterium]
MSEYYCLTSSLKELNLDGDAKELNLDLVFEEIEGSLAMKDGALYRDFKTQYDIQNIISLINGRSMYITMGNLPQSAVEAVVESFKSDKNDASFEEGEFFGLDKVVIDVLRAYKNSITASELEINTSLPIENILQTQYFRKMSTVKSAFLRKWFQFDLDMRNICSAFTARAKQRDITSIVVGEGDIQSLLVSSAAADFGLKGVFDYSDELFATLSMEDMLQKERKLDDIRWDKIDELVTFDYFNIEVILSYVAKVAIINRWLMLDEKVGREMLRKLTDDLAKNKLNFEIID